MTVLEAITEASVMGGSSALGETLNDADAAYGLSKLNQMIDIWSIDRLTIPKRERVGPFNLVSGTQSYLVGSGLAWDTPRPTWIDAAGMIDVLPGDDVELPMRILTQKEWARVPVKTIRSPLPRSLYYDRTVPGGTIYLYPVPNVANQIVLYVPVAVAEFADLATTLALPPGYRMAIISNLAILIAMGSVEVDASVSSLAIATYAAIKAANVVDQMDPMVCDDALLPRAGGNFNWLSGETSA